MIDLKDFIQQGRQRLEPYLSGITEFIADRHKHPGQGSRQLRQKPPDTYLRNMLALGVLSQLSRSEFMKQQNRLIVLPDCLKNYDDWTCCKADLDGASVCTQCNSDCFVFETMERFSDDHTTIVLEPEDLPQYLDDLIRKTGRFGVVGVACVLTLLSGFKTTLERKLPTQGVFLNYSSCGHHWADPPYNTSFSYRRMARVLGHDDGEPDPISFPGRGETYSLVRHPNSPDEFYRELDDLTQIFKTEFLPVFMKEYPQSDIYDLSLTVMDALVPDLVTRDSA